MGSDLARAFAAEGGDLVLTTRTAAKLDSLIEEIVRVDMPTKWGNFKLIAFNEKGTTNEHLALIKGEWGLSAPEWFLNGRGPKYRKYSHVPAGQPIR